MKSLIIIPFLCVISRSLVFSSEYGVDFGRQPIELEEKTIVKRQAHAGTPTPRQPNNNYTSVKTAGGCKLYALEVEFFKRTSKQEAGTGFDSIEVLVPGTKLVSIEGVCSNYSGSIILKYAGGLPDMKGNEALNDLTLNFTISNLKHFGWWELSALGVEASGKMIGSTPFKQKFEGYLMRSIAIGASKKFSYACGQPPTLFYSEGEKSNIVYGIRFKNLQIQPFDWVRSPGNFTNNVDDCVPFFSIGIWMFLIVAAVLLLVVFFGIGMISSLKTMDRFDDPKGKPMVINAKE